MAKGKNTVAHTRGVLIINHTRCSIRIFFNAEYKFGSDDEVIKVPKNTICKIPCPSFAYIIIIRILLRAAQES